jgi:hypothetical protein
MVGITSDGVVAGTGAEVPLAITILASGNIATDGDVVLALMAGIPTGGVGTRLLVYRRSRTRVKGPHGTPPSCNLRQDCR